MMEEKKNLMTRQNRDLNFLFRINHNKGIVVLSPWREIVQILTGPELIHKKQKNLVVLKFLGVSCLFSIPLTINFLNSVSFKPWQITICVAALGCLALVLHRFHLELQQDLDRACHQLGPGVRLVKKFKKSNHEEYQIFQEGHRYYYLLHLETGEKRLVAKEKILQDYDIAL